MTTKHDQSKPRFSLIPVGTLNAVIRVLEFGARFLMWLDDNSKDDALTLKLGEMASLGGEHE